MNSRQPLVPTTYAIAGDAQTVSFRYHFGSEGERVSDRRRKGTTRELSKLGFIVSLPVAANHRFTSAMTQHLPTFRLRLGAVEWDPERTGEVTFHVSPREYPV